MSLQFHGRWNWIFSYLWLSIIFNFSENPSIHVRIFFNWLWSGGSWLHRYVCLSRHWRRYLLRRLLRRCWLWCLSPTSSFSSSPSLLSLSIINFVKYHHYCHSSPSPLTLSTDPSACSPPPPMYADGTMSFVRFHFSHEQNRDLLKSVVNNCFY